MGPPSKKREAVLFQNNSEKQHDSRRFLFLTSTLRSPIPTDRNTGRRGQFTYQELAPCVGGCAKIS